MVSNGETVSHQIGRFYEPSGLCAEWKFRSVSISSLFHQEFFHYSYSLRAWSLPNPVWMWDASCIRPPFLILIMISHFSFESHKKIKSWVYPLSSGKGMSFLYERKLSLNRDRWTRTPQTSRYHGSYCS